MVCSLAYADSEYSSGTTTHNSTNPTNWVGNVTIGTETSTATVILENIGTGQTGNTIITINREGTLQWKVNTDTYPLEISATRPALANPSGSLSIRGTGTFLLTPSETTNAIFVADAQGGTSLEIAMGVGGTISLDTGATFINGGWQRPTWTNNYGNLHLNAGSTFNVWDGVMVYVNQLTGTGAVTFYNGGSGLVQRNKDGMTVGHGGTEDFTFDGDVSGDITITKTGSGTMTFTGTSTNSNSVNKTAAWVVSEGGLVLDGASATGKVRVDNGFLGMKGETTVANLELTDNSTLQLINTAGTKMITDLTLGENLTLDVVLNETSVDEFLELLQTTSTVDLSAFTTLRLELPTGEFWQYGSVVQEALSWSGNALMLDISVTTRVPEPGTWGMCLLGGLLLFLRRKFQKRR
ncbi:MAG: PEP-CTERM sorting domain-containing protein [Planctomycetia bacterium]|nr:PEP-CTERM sorting domain-containing protein [Planctomycetia bacterium]